MRKIKDDRYRKLQELADLIDGWPAADVLQAIHDQLDDDRSEAQDYYDARAERWQESEKGEQYQEWLYRLEDVVNALDEIISSPGDEDAIQNYFDVFSDLTQAPGNEVTQQEMFDRVARHLLTQMEKSIDESGACAYRGDQGRMCAIGTLIPPDKYNPQWDSQYPAPGAGHPDIMEACGYGPGSTGWLKRCKVHDNTEPKQWRAELRAVAEYFNLTFPEGRVIHQYTWSAFAEALGTSIKAQLDDPEIHDPIIDFAEHTPVQLYNAVCKLRALAFGLPKSTSRTYIIAHCAEAMRRLEQET